VTPVLELEDLAVAYGKRRALDGLDLSVGPGEIVTLLGANGAGKSTTLRAVSGLVRPTRGRIRYEGRDITQAPADTIVAAGVSHVPEGREIFPEFTVHENLLVGAHTVERARVGERLESVFGLFPVLRDRRAQTAGTLSGGEQQMLAIGRALMTRPRLLLLDEPSLGLSPRMQGDVFATVQRIAAAGVTVLIVEQNVRGALLISDRALVMEQGRKFMEGPADEVRTDPRIRQAYLGGNIQQTAA
jgi:branched-chain amino acid transport system ATP-binding protein